MTRGRLEAFSDGVIAILITIMVLELKVPSGDGVDALRSMLPVFFAYVLSFVFVGIYWNNHYHLLQFCTRVDGRVLWANLHLLFWLSLVPVVTAWIGHYPSAPLPTALYGTVLLLAGIAYVILQWSISAAQGAESTLRDAVGRDFKGKLSVALCMAAIPTAFVYEPIADAIYVVVALMWFVPDRRLERALRD